jgi:iron(III) transport system substrate-binding protein
MKRLAKIFLALVFLLGVSPNVGFAAAARSAEEIWKSLEKLPAPEREKKLIEGARGEGEMLWYTNSGVENANRYIQAFRKNYPFINANFWRSKTRQVTQRVVAEANAGRHLVDVVKPSTDLLPVLLERQLIGRYDTPIRAIYPAHAKSAYYTNMNYAFRVFAFNSRKLNRKDAPKSWDDLLQPRWKGEILFDESSLEEVSSSF